MQRQLTGTKFAAGLGRSTKPGGYFFQANAGSIRYLYQSRLGDSLLTPVPAVGKGRLPVARLATPVDGEVVWSDREPEVSSEAPFEAVVERAGHLRDRSARLAHQVKMVRVGKMVHGRAVAEMGVLDDALSLESVQGPVDGRGGDLGVLAVDAVGELLGGDVAGGPPAPG